MEYLINLEQLYLDNSSSFSTAMKFVMMQRVIFLIKKIQMNFLNERKDIKFEDIKFFKVQKKSRFFLENVIFFNSAKLNQKFLRKYNKGISKINN
jgi:hypothetical protein